MKNNATKTQNRGTEEEKENGMESDLHDLFLDELADILNAEQQLIKALPKMAKAAKSEDLTKAFEAHLAETENQITRLQQVFETLGEPVKRKKCKGMEGLLAEGKEMMDEMKDTAALDASLIASAQKVEHYEIASYGSMIAWAEQMGHSEAVELLQENLDEEKAADEKLTAIAESGANEEAEAS